MNYVIPYAKHRTNTGSGAGVPLILKSKGLASGEDEQLKKQRRITSLDIDKGYFEGCESTLAYVQSNLIRLLQSHGVRIPEQIIE